MSPLCTMKILAATAAISVVTTFAFAKEDGSGEPDIPPDIIDIQIVSDDLAPTAQPVTQCSAETIRIPPRFPARCLSVPGDEHQVTVQFDINDVGATENIEVIDYSDSCFAEAAEASVQSWLYACEETGQTGKKTRIKFNKELPPASEAPETQPQSCSPPLVRIPPQFPKKCMRVPGKRHYVIVRFDVDENGATRNIEVIERSNKCFSQSAKRAVSRWRYCAGVVRAGIETEIAFVRY